jgi:hypothetical protein
MEFVVVFIVLSGVAAFLFSLVRERGRRRLRGSRAVDSMLFGDPAAHSFSSDAEAHARRHAGHAHDPSQPGGEAHHHSHNGHHHDHSHQADTGGFHSHDSGSHDFGAGHHGCSSVDSGGVDSGGGHHH